MEGEGGFIDSLGGPRKQAGLCWGENPEDVTGFLVSCALQSPRRTRETTVAYKCDAGLALSTAGLRGAPIHTCCLQVSYATWLVLPFPLL